MLTRTRFRVPATSILCTLLALAGSSVAAAAAKTVRTVTAFIDLDATHYEQQFTDAAHKLQAAKAYLEKQGYVVQTVRVTTQPFMDYVGVLNKPDALATLQKLEQLAAKDNVMVSIGPAVMDDHPDPRALEILEDLHGRGSSLNATMMIAGDSGIYWNSIKAAAHHVWRVAERSPHSQGNFSFAAIAMIAPGSPFFPASYHLKGESGRFAMGLQTADRVDEVFKQAKGDAPRAMAELTKVLSAQATEVHRLAAEIARQSGWTYWGFDPTPTPMKDVSIGQAMEDFNGTPFGSSGTLTAAYIITQAQREVPGPRIGYSGLMLPVLEDARLAQRWNEGSINLDSLLSYSSVCGTGLDAVPLPGDVTEEQLARIISDVAVLGYKWKKPLTARLQPVHGKKAGEMSEFDSPYLINVKLQPVR